MKDGKVQKRNHARIRRVAHGGSQHKDPHRGVQLFFRMLAAQWQDSVAGWGGGKEHPNVSEMLSRRGVIPGQKAGGLSHCAMSCVGPVDRDLH